MFKSLRIALLAVCLPGAALAADPAFTPAQRLEIIRIMREALKADPSILRDAVNAMQAEDQDKEAEASRAAVAANRKSLFNTMTDPQAGNLAGDVTLVEFYDPRCPYCRRVLAGIADLISKDKKLRLVYKDIPVLGPDSTLETKAILAAQRQGAYLKMQEALMSDPGKPTEAGIRAIAAKLGLDANKLVADMNGDAVSTRIKENMALARAMKVTGTPTFVIGDTVIPGAVQVSELEDQIAEARKHKVN